mmetsp:Transcript_26156/g.62141  ORF Transcript_26156/g.62141 Transcript_26156/m.62141 type:complete len:231 (-) Transcript_26156:861-1553(-)
MSSIPLGLAPGLFLLLLKTDEFLEGLLFQPLDAIPGDGLDFDYRLLRCLVGNDLLMTTCCGLDFDRSSCMDDSFLRRLVGDGLLMTPNRGLDLDRSCIRSVGIILLSCRGRSTEDQHHVQQKKNNHCSIVCCRTLLLHPTMEVTCQVHDNRFTLTSMVPDGAGTATIHRNERSRICLVTCWRHHLHRSGELIRRQTRTVVVVVVVVVVKTMTACPVQDNRRATLCRATLG